MSEISSEHIKSFISESLVSIFKSCIAELESNLGNELRKECSIIHLKLSELEDRIRSDIQRIEKNGDVENAFGGTPSQQVYYAVTERGKETSQQPGNGWSGHVFNRSSNLASRPPGRARRSAQISGTMSNTSLVQRSYFPPQNPADTVFVSYERRWGRIVYNKHRTLTNLDASSATDQAERSRGLAFTEISPSDAAPQSVEKHEQESVIPAEGKLEVCGHSCHKKHTKLAGNSASSAASASAEDPDNVQTAPASQKADTACSESGHGAQDRLPDGSLRERAVSIDIRERLSHRNSVPRRESISSNRRSNQR
jgi:hypothetical protein